MDSGSTSQACLASLGIQAATALLCSVVSIERGRTGACARGEGGRDMAPRTEEFRHDQRRTGAARGSWHCMAQHRCTRRPCAQHHPAPVSRLVPPVCHTAPPQGCQDGSAAGWLSRNASWPAAELRSSLCGRCCWGSRMCHCSPPAGQNLHRPCALPPRPSIRTTFDYSSHPGSLHRT